MPIEQVAANLEQIVATDGEVEWLGTGYGGFDERGRLTGVAEGPLWWRPGEWSKDGGYLLFSDIAANRRLRWTPGKGVTIDQEGTNNANGLTRDRMGRLVACEHGARRVTRKELDGSTTVIANNYRGQRLNRPNDVVVKSDGSIYFTDPNTRGISELDFAGVYRVAPDLGEINLLVRDFIVPNGLAFSPDEKILYINDSRRRHIRAFNLESTWQSGMLDLASDRVFCELTGSQRGVPDGMKVDIEGNVYCTGPGGVWIINAAGEHLGTILLGDRVATNVAFGGDKWTTLFITTYNELGRIQMKIPGIPVPRGNL
ncbi:MAG TPA: SMP-30/gluconolactonase/LRE family protein [Candidatus Binataceae bacterium]|nr:SMP-30/gluconolactonase/LRE family protein [Candidatus Binataceae bacterium]